MHLPLLNDILILLISSVAIVFILQRLKLPSIIGLLLTGVIIGPYGLSLIEAVEQVETLAEIGVILLFRELFTSFFFVSIGMFLDLSFFVNPYLMWRPWCW
jgi:Kef-type K+ transport system membrane component KefB